MVCKMSSNMNIASKFESHTVYSCRNTFQTLPGRAHSVRISVNLWAFRKCPNFMISEKCTKNVQWQDISCIVFLVYSDFEALFKLCKRSFVDCI